MTKLLQLHFDYHGPFGEDMSNQLVELAQSINDEPGFMWKIWTENSETQEAGGIYAFESEETALAYVAKHTSRLKLFGVEEVIYKLFDINEPLTLLNKGRVK